MAEKTFLNFYKGAGFFHSCSTNFLVLYMFTGATPPDSWGHCTSFLYCSPLMKVIYSLSFYTVDHTL